jgi:hypothetical protein
MVFAPEIPLSAAKKSLVTEEKRGGFLSLFKWAPSARYPPKKVSKKSFLAQTKSFQPKIYLSYLRKMIWDLRE